MKAVAVLTLSLIAGLAGSPRSSSRPANPPACVAPQYRQFDFWIGDWDAFDVADPKTTVARTRVDRILDGCVLLEDYMASNGSHGESFSIYDASRNVWHQSWVTNRGRLLVIEGGSKAGAMILSGTDRQEDGSERRIRGVWKPVSGGVRETAFTSTDGGKNWNLWFDLVFRPHHSAR